MFPAFQHFELTVRDRTLFSRREGGRSGKLGNSNLFFMFPELKLLNNSSRYNLVNNVSSHYDFEHLSQNFKYSGNSIHRHLRSRSDADEFCFYNQMFFYKKSQFLHILITFSLFFMQPA